MSFDGFRALNDLSLTVEPGEMRAIIGPNGAGKTTMMDVITGKTRPDKGDVYFDGSFDLTTLDETQIAELGIGRKFQKPTVFEMHTVEDNLRLALKGERQARKTLLWRETPAEQARINEILGIIRLGAVRGASPAACRTGRSSGSRSACCWRRIPKLLLVDEPVAGMTDVETHQTAELLKEINRQQDRGGGRARHDLRARARRQGHVPARRLGAGRRHDRSGLDERARGRSLSGAMR